MNIENIRHSLSHLLAMAVLEKYPGTKLGIGPAVETGFYYDFEFPENSSLTDADLNILEEKMRQLISQDIKFVRGELSADDAKKMFSQEPYKLELIEDLEKDGQQMSTYASADFTDLCAGPHVDSTKDIPAAAFKLHKVAGAYWRGDEKNKMLTRIYGLAFASKSELDNYLTMLEEAAKRDHKKLGKELGLFIFSELVGPGLPIYTHKGAIVRREIIKLSNELQQEIGYQEVHTPNMNKAELFKVSGHYDKYKEDMFRVVSNYTKEEYYLKPMNCPQHTQIYAAEKRSYRELPIRIADFANLYRDEKPGELSGLTRLRSFCQDDGHCFCREDQIREEFLAVLSAIKKALTTYGMSYSIRLSLWDPEHPEKYLGEASVWERSQKLLEDILIENNIAYEKAVGEAAIYGPKMDLISSDSIGRKWQISTIQLDFIMPARFGLTYVDQDGSEKTPVMIHRALVGSPERFLGILIEHYAGNFPTWLAPVQAIILPIGESQQAYTKDVLNQLKEAGIRAELDDSNDSLGKRIRNAKLTKVPYVLVVGDKEVADQAITVEKRGSEKKGESKKLTDFITEMVEEIKKRK